MRQRCNNKKHKGFPNYGGRGIKVCPRWDGSFAEFLADMGERPSRRHWLERDDNDKGYEPGNVRWATTKEQARNRNTNVNLEYKGQTKTLSEWAEITGLTAPGLTYRMSQGWTPEQIIETPSRGGNLTRGGKTLTLNSETLTITQWARRLGMNKATLQVRKRNGWTDAEILTTPVRTKSKPKDRKM